jgi:hypothetical protein
MHPSSLLSYYPTYSILDEILSYSNEYKGLNLFFDLKNNLQSTYMKHTIENLVEDSKNLKFVNTSIFSSLLSFLSFHKLYSIKRDIDIKFYIFYENGRSYYHQNINKKYKISRRIDDLHGLDRKDRELFFDIINKNLLLIEKACNKMPDIKVLKLDHMEADFLPYYLINKSKINQKNKANVIYSNDHDMYQTLNENTYMFSKSSKSKKIIKSGNICELELKEIINDYNIDDSYFPLLLSIIGDPGDDVQGIKGIGKKTFIKIFPELKKMFKDMNSIYNNIMDNKPIFDTTFCDTKNKFINKIIDEENNNKLISNNLKLVSFELISKEFENPSSTEMLNRNKKIQNILDDNTISNQKNIMESLNMINIDMNGDELDMIYFQK